MKRRAWLALAAAAFPAAAQQDWARVAVPSYGPAAVLRGLHAHWTLPRAREFRAAAGALQQTLVQRCEGRAALPAARDAWRGAMQAWERLSAVALGPLLTRRSARQIDFTPTRPRLIERALNAGAPWNLALIGTPAKGLPALEWLLWTQPAEPGTPACRYALALAAEIVVEADALEAAFAELAAREWTDDAAVAGVNEFVNQWVGGLERLRWPGMEKPLRAERPGELPRAASGSTAAAWAAQWDALRALAVFEGRAAPAPGAGLVPLETWLRGRGQNPLAGALVQAVQRSSTALQGLQPTAPPAVWQAAQSLAALKHLAEAQVAPALEVSIGFSDADGD